MLKPWDVAHVHVEEILSAEALEFLGTVLCQQILCDSLTLPGMQDSALALANCQ